jgi:hypothetical protein
MSTFPGSPRLIKGGIVLIDSDTLAERYWKFYEHIRTQIF